MQQPNLRILIIDDSPSIHKDFIKTLSSDKSEKLSKLEQFIFNKKEEPAETNLLPKFQIDSAMQGQEGIERIGIALQEDQPYAVAFVDIRMPPGWDGLETIKHIWELDPNIQVVICSAHSDASWEETIQKLGHRDNLLILKKPFEPIIVRQIACALTKKWQLLYDARSRAKMLENRANEGDKLYQQILAVNKGVLAISADGILIIDNENNIIDYNKKLVDMWQLPSTILKDNQGLSILEEISTQIELAAEFISFVRIDSLETSHTRVDKCNDGRIIETSINTYKMNNKAAGKIWYFRDITEHAVLEEKIHFQATHDALTNLPNRTLLLEAIQEEIAEATKNDHYFAVLFFDLDRFKLINSTYNSNVGDALLTIVAKRMKHIIREVDFLARLGGDEFVCVIKFLKNSDDIKKIATKLINTFQDPIHIDDQKITVSASLGISLFPQDGKTADEILSCADMAMYMAKEKGGNQFTFYNKA